MCLTSAKFDGFFGSARFNDEYQSTHGSVSVGALWDERDGLDPALRFRLRMQLPQLSDQAANYLRLVGLLAAGVGMLYVVSGRTNAEGFIFASLLDRPLVPFVMAALWYFGLIPAPLAIAFAVQDFGSFLWTLAAWRTERRELVAAELPLVR